MKDILEFKKSLDHMRELNEYEMYFYQTYMLYPHIIDHVSQTTRSKQESQSSIGIF